MYCALSRMHGRTSWEFSKCGSKRRMQAILQTCRSQPHARANVQPLASFCSTMRWSSCSRRILWSNANGYSHQTSTRPPLWCAAKPAVHCRRSWRTYQLPVCIQCYLNPLSLNWRSRFVILRNIWVVPCPFPPFFTCFIIFCMPALTFKKTFDFIRFSFKNVNYSYTSPRLQANRHFFKIFKNVDLFAVLKMCK